MKKIICLLLAVLLLPVISVNADEASLAITCCEVKNLYAEISGGTNLSDNSIITLRVYQNGADISTALPTQLINLSTTKATSGKYKFSFPIYELRGSFPVVITANNTNIEETSLLIFNPSGDSSIKSFSVDNYACIINGFDISVTIPSNASKEGMIATFDVHKDAIVKIGDAVQKNGETRVNFTLPVTYTVIADDGTESTYTVTVTNAQGLGGGSGSGGGGGGAGGGFAYTEDNNKDKEDDKAETKPEEKPQEVIKESSFTDLSKEHWAYEYINNLYIRNVVNGYEDGSFRPDRPVKREEFIKIISELFKPEVSGNISFSDVKTTDWYYPYVNVAYNSGIINGISPQLFGTGSNITREDAAVIIARVINYKKISFEKVSDTDFSDIESISDYALEAVKTLKSYGLINGYDANDFRPKGNLSRAELCKLVLTIYEQE